MHKNYRYRYIQSVLLNLEYLLATNELYEVLVVLKEKNTKP